MTKIGAKRNGKKRLTIREYMEKYYPEEESGILEGTKITAKKVFDANTLIRSVSVPFFLPITLDDYLPTMSYVIYNRNLQEISPEGEIING